MNRVFLQIFALLTLALPLVGCSQGKVGTKSRPFTMYFVPPADAEGILSTADGASKFVAKFVSQGLYGKDKGFYVKSAIPLDYVTVVEAFATKKADFATFQTFPYILAKDIKKEDVEPILTVVRGKNERTYRGQIIVRAGSGINSLKDLNGKKFAYTDPSSTSGFLLPHKLLKDKGIKLGQVVFGKKHDNVVTMVYQKQVDAGATYYSPPIEKMINGKKVLYHRDARQRVVTQFPDVFKKVKIIAFTDPIPNEPWVIRRHLFKDDAMNKKVIGLVKEALKAYAKTPQGSKALNSYYDLTGLIDATNSMYDGIRKIVLGSKINLEKMFAPKKKG